MMERMPYDELFAHYQDLRKKLQYYDEYDLLTGIYNKDTFYQKAEELFRDTAPNEWILVCIDIEHFKVINDLYGTERGNQLLRYLAENLQQNIFAEPGILARLAADIYAGCMPADSSLETLERSVQEVFREAPLDIDIIPAIGIYQVTDPTLSVEKMCDRAILALNSIKGNYLKHCALYDERLWVDMLLEQDIINRADYALNHGEFKVVMQPKCNMKTGKVVGAEALVRWEHAERGFIPPSAFIPVFEKNGFIKRLDAFIWEEVVRWLCRWIQQGNRPIPISVNVSRMDIIGMDLFAILQQILNKYRIPPSLLELEITESAYSSRLEEIIVTVEKLMCSGYTVLMDDFGSGYSSLNMLKDININILKLDLRFLDNTNQKSRDILTSIVHMAKWLNLRVIAEGVETKSQVDFLVDIGCEYAQGYYYYKPMFLDAFERLLINETNIDYNDQQHAQSVKENLINFKELFYADMMSEQLLNNIVGGIALYHYNGETLTINRCNSEYYRMTGHTELPRELDVLTLMYEEDVPKMHAALLEAKNQGNQGVEVIIRRRLENQGLLWLQIRLFYLAEANGNSVYYAGVLDVTADMNAVEELRLSEQRFRLAMDASDSTLFELDVETGLARYAKHTQAEYGLEDCVTEAPEGFIQQGSVCPEYVEDFRALYREIYEGKERASCVLRAQMGDGSFRWNRITLIALKNKEGKTLKAIGLVQNVTREREPETVLRSLNA